MRILNKYSQYAVLLTSELSTNTYMPLQPLAEQYQVSVHMLAQVASKLKAANVLVSKKGPGGGYRLTNSQVSLFEVVKPFMPRGSDSLVYEVEDGIQEFLRQSYIESTNIDQFVHADHTVDIH